MSSKIPLARGGSVSPEWWGQYDQNIHRGRPYIHLGTLLTGDIDLWDGALLKHFTDFYRYYLSSVSIFQVPHHGSKENWHFNHPSGLEVFYRYVINHGVGRKDHPSVNVIEDIKTHCKDGNVKLNNEVDGFGYGFNM